jgi:hypothetical protein
MVDEIYGFHENANPSPLAYFTTKGPGKRNSAPDSVTQSALIRLQTEN